MLKAIRKLISGFRRAGRAEAFAIGKPTRLAHDAWPALPTREALDKIERTLDRQRAGMSREERNRKTRDRHRGELMVRQLHD